MEACGHRGEVFSLETAPREGGDVDIDALLFLKVDRKPMIHIDIVDIAHVPKLEALLGEGAGGKQEREDG